MKDYIITLILSIPAWAAITLFVIVFLVGLLWAMAWMITAGGKQ